MSNSESRPYSEGDGVAQPGKVPIVPTPSPEKNQHVVTLGVTPPYLPYFAAKLATDSENPAVCVLVPESKLASVVAKDIALYLPPAMRDLVFCLPEPDSSPYQATASDRSSSLEQMRVLAGFSSGRFVCVTSFLALTRKTLPPELTAALSSEVTAGQTIEREQFIARLSRAGYERTSLVIEPGQFSVRGGVLDVWPGSEHTPLRLDLFGDEIESLRRFDPSTQRSLENAMATRIGPVRDTMVTDLPGLKARLYEAADLASCPTKEVQKYLELLTGQDDFSKSQAFLPALHAEVTPVWKYLPQSTLFLNYDAATGFARYDDMWQKWQSSYEAHVENHELAFPPHEHALTPDELTSHVAKQKRVIDLPALEIVSSKKDSSVTVAVQPLTSLSQALNASSKENAQPFLPLVKELSQLRDQGIRAILTCQTEIRRKRILGLLESYELRFDRYPLLPEAMAEMLNDGQRIAVVDETPSAGFIAPAEKLAILTEDDLFGKRQHQAKNAKRAAERAKKALLGNTADFSALAEGDFVVHALHGIGRYRGLTTLPVKNAMMDFVHVEYQGGTLYLPVYRLAELARYVGAEGQKPRLDKLGGQSFAKTRKSVSEKVKRLAEELLVLYAERASRPGHAFPPDDAMMLDFVAAFPFDETPDQATAIAATLDDMESARPMDRLVCGDVGYGKTEVALRAIFKAAAGGKQSALLAPTTVLVEQHFQTMKNRFENWPIRIGKLSRFQSKAEQAQTVKLLAEGSLDAIVGTHRLLSNDIRFKDLGLLVVDEEQRFGIAHKERLKRFRTNVDVLTLTATPIPRTLHLSMSGLRDMSIIATPPVDRRAVHTLLASTENSVIHEAIARELARGGQAFVVAPRIDANTANTLSGWVERIRSLCPTAKVAMLHGQMPAETLETVMVDFVKGNYDVLVATTIIESGLDIPRANTILIAEADRFGLAQLYQLRGRVGRSSVQAYCYLLVENPGGITMEAKRRLNAMQRHSELGSGFVIASHDLEIRGAGELLGEKQSGSIAAVGFDAYVAMLEEAIAELQGQPLPSEVDAELSTDLPGTIPDDYIPDPKDRLILYKRLSHSESAADVSELLAEVEDRFGPVPDATVLLADIMRVKIAARPLKVQSLELGAQKMALAFRDGTPLTADHIVKLIGMPKSPYRFSKDQRLLVEFSQAGQKQPCEAAQNAIAEILRVAAATPAAKTSKA